MTRRRTVRRCRFHGTAGRRYRIAKRAPTARESAPKTLVFLAPMQPPCRSTRALKTPTAPRARTAGAFASRSSLLRRARPRMLATSSRYSTIRRSARTTSASSTPTAAQGSLASAVTRTSTVTRTFACQRATARSTRTARPPVSARPAMCSVKRPVSATSAMRRTIPASTTPTAQPLGRRYQIAASTRRVASGAVFRSCTPSSLRRASPDSPELAGGLQEVCALAALTFAPRIQHLEDAAEGQPPAMDGLDVARATIWRGGRGASETPSPSVAESCVIPAVAAHAIERAGFGRFRRDPTRGCPQGPWAARSATQTAPQGPRSHSVNAA